MRIENVHVAATPERLILAGVSCTVFVDEFVVLLGANGSGKSSLLKVMEGGYVPSRGAVHFQGGLCTPRQLQRRTRDIVVLTQEVRHSTFDHLTGWEHVQLAAIKPLAWPWSRHAAQTEEQARQWIAAQLPHLVPHLHQEVSSLSGGQRQQLALALCLLHPPKLLLLDEHTSALDPVASERVMEQTAQHVAIHGVTTVMTTHRLDHALRYGNRLWVMHDGYLVADLDAAQKQRLTVEELRALAYQI